MAKEVFERDLFEKFQVREVSTTHIPAAACLMSSYQLSYCMVLPIDAHAQIQSQLKHWHYIQAVCTVAELKPDPTD